jgi:hypothetical protein
MEINNTLRLLRMVVFGTCLLFFSFSSLCRSSFSVGVASVFSFIVIILGALITHYTVNFFGFFYDYAALGIATGLLTILTLPGMFVQRTISGLCYFLTLHKCRLALSMIRKGAITSMIAVEIGWVCKYQPSIFNVLHWCVIIFWPKLGFLWIMWIAVGGNTAGIFFLGNCAELGFGTWSNSWFAGRSHSTFLGSIVDEAACNETTALTAFGFLTWILCKFAAFISQEES